MKMIRATLGLLLCAALVARAQLPPAIKITVEKQQKVDRDVKQKAAQKDVGYGTVYHPQVADRNQEVVFSVKLQNAGGKDLKGLIVKYALLSRQLGTKKVEVAASGEETIDLRPLQIQVVQTKPATFTTQETKYNNLSSSNLDRQEGKKYYGIAVTVFSGTTKIATLYDPPSVEKDLGAIDKDF